MFYGVEDENPQHLHPTISNCTVITAIRTSHFGKAVIDDEGMPSLEPSQLLCIKAFKLYGEL